MDNDATDPVKFWAIDKNSDGALDVVFVYSGEASNSNKTYFYVGDWEAYESYDKNKPMLPSPTTAMTPPSWCTSSSRRSPSTRPSP